MRVHDAIDYVISGNYKGITTLYGPASSGKTTMALQMASLTKGKILYLDSEGVSAERMQQICPNMENIIVLRLKNFRNQHDEIIKLLDYYNCFSLIILDTIGNYFKTFTKNKGDLGKMMLMKQMRTIKKMSIKVPFVICNQVYFDINSKKIKMAGSRVVEIDSDIIIELEKNEKRFAILNGNKKTEFAIANSGIILP